MSESAGRLEVLAPRELSVNEGRGRREAEEKGWRRSDGGRNRVMKVSEGKQK